MHINNFNIIDLRYKCINRFLLFTVLISALSLSAKENWKFKGSLTSTPGYPIAWAQGLAVDGEGKIWYTSYMASDTVWEDRDGDGIDDYWNECRAIYVLYPDGQQISWSPIKTLTYKWGNEELTDIIFQAPRGLECNPDGDIVAAFRSELYLIDHKTGKCLRKMVPYPTSQPGDPWDGQTLTKPAFDNNGNMFVCTVYPGFPIKVYDSDWNYIRNAIPPEYHNSYSRTIEVSPDGNDIYYCGYTGDYGFLQFHSDNGIYGNYHSKIDPYLPSLSVEASAWQPGTGYLWGGHTADYAKGNDIYVPGCFYSLDPNTGMVVDSIITDTIIDGKDVRPRGISFSLDGHTAYISYFYCWDVEAVYVFYRDKILPQEEWRIQLSVSADELYDSDNFIGTSWTATDGFDKNIDIPKPPTPPDRYVQLFFPHTEYNLALNNYSTDIRFPENLIYVQKIFDFIIITDQIGIEHKLSINPQFGITYNDGIYLRDRGVDELIPINSEYATYTFIPSLEGEYSFQLLVGKQYPFQGISKQYYSGLNMISLPLDPLDHSINELFLDDFSPPLYSYSYYAHSGYLEVDSLDIIKGYWLKLSKNTALDLIGDSLYCPQSIGLTKGFNLIGNPFKYAICVDNFIFSNQDTNLSFDQAVVNGWVSGMMHHWLNREKSGYILTDTLDVWWGVWLNVFADSMNLTINPNKISPDYNSRLNQITEDGWILPINVSSSWGIDYSNAFGINLNASNGFDPCFDFVEPPNPPEFDYITGFFQNNNQNMIIENYDWDIRSSNSGYLEWKYIVHSSKNGAVTLSWHPANFPPDKGNIALIDSIKAKSIDMRADSTYTFFYDQQPRIFKIIYNLGSQIESNNYPIEYSISQNYPNPFNPVTKINYQLPKSGMVNLSVYNINGQLVETLVKEYQNAGYYSIQFDASILSSGVYIYKIIAGEFTDIKKCMIVK